MTEEGNPEFPVEVAGHDVLARSQQATLQIKVGSRLGVWGFVGGFCVMIAFTLGGPVSLNAAMLASQGYAAGGDESPAA